MKCQGVEVWVLGSSSTYATCPGSLSSVCFVLRSFGEHMSTFPTVPTMVNHPSNSVDRVLDIGPPVRRSCVRSQLCCLRQDPTHLLPLFQVKVFNPNGKKKTKKKCEERQRKINQTSKRNKTCSQNAFYCNVYHTDHNKP